MSRTSRVAWLLFVGALFGFRAASARAETEPAAPAPDTAEAQRSGSALAIHSGVHCARHAADATAMQARQYVVFFAGTRLGSVKGICSQSWAARTRPSVSPGR